MELDISLELMVKLKIYFNFYNMGYTCNICKDFVDEAYYIGTIYLCESNKFILYKNKTLDNLKNHNP